MLKKLDLMFTLFFYINHMLITTYSNHPNNPNFFNRYGDIVIKDKQGHYDFGLVPADLDKELDLEPYVNTSAFAINEMHSLKHCYSMFRMMALRTLTVVNFHNEPIGVITRKDLQSDVIMDRITQRLGKNPLKYIQNLSSTKTAQNYFDFGPQDSKHSSPGHSPRFSRDPSRNYTNYSKHEELDLNMPKSSSERFQQAFTSRSPTVYSLHRFPDNLATSPKVAWTQKNQASPESSTFKGSLSRQDVLSSLDQPLLVGTPEAEISSRWRTEAANDVNMSSPFDHDNQLNSAISMQAADFNRMDQERGDVDN